MRLQLILAFIVLVTCDHPPSEFVTELTGDTFSELTKSGKSVLTMFYAPWCGHCKRTMPTFETTCKRLKEQLGDDFVCGRVDCTQHEDFCRDSDIKGYPTLKMKQKETVCEYRGQREEEPLVQWSANFHKGQSDINSLDEIKERIQAGQWIVGYFDENSELRDLVRSISCDLSSVNFAVISNEEIAKELAIPQKNTFNIFVDQVFVKSITDVTDSNSILREIFFATNPLLPEYTHETVRSIFSNYVFYYVAFIFDKAETLEKHKSELETFAKQQMPKIRVFTVDGSNPTYKDVLDYFHVESLPQVVFYNDKEQNYNHFTQSSDISTSSLSVFADGCIDGSVPIYQQRQPIPENWEQEEVKVLVTDTYEKIFEMYKSGIMLYFAPWCGHCEALMPTWTKLGSLVASKYPEIFVAKIDHTNNHVPDSGIQGYPTVIAFKSRNEKVVYSGDRTLEDLEKFILTNLLPEKLPEETPKVEEKATEEEKTEGVKEDL